VLLLSENSFSSVFNFEKQQKMSFQIPHTPPLTTTTTTRKVLSTNLTEHYPINIESLLHRVLSLDGR
jgi:hypothetical protein